MTEPVKYIAPRLTPDRLKESEQTRRMWSMTPAINTSVEHLLKPEYWLTVANRFNPTDQITVIAEDNAWFAELLVISCGKNYANVKLLRYVPLDASAGKCPAVLLKDPVPAAEKPTETAQLKVNYGGVKARHRVVRVADGEVMKEGFPTQAEAIKWMHEYEVNNLIAA